MLRYSRHALNGEQNPGVRSPGVFVQAKAAKVCLRLRDYPDNTGALDISNFSDKKAELDQFLKGKIDRNVDEDDRRFKDNQIAWFDELMADGRIESRFNTIFFTAGDSRDPELAGIWGAAKGSFFMLCEAM